MNLMCSEQEFICSLNQSDVLGLMLGSGLCLHSVSIAAFKPSLFGILVWKLQTSNDTKTLSYGTLHKSLMILRKCAVSFTYDLRSLFVGFKK